jgi:hypothetical protein
MLVCDALRRAKGASDRTSREGPARNRPALQLAPELRPKHRPLHPARPAWVRRRPERVWVCWWIAASIRGCGRTITREENSATSIGPSAPAPMNFPIGAGTPPPTTQCTPNFVVTPGGTVIPIPQPSIGPFPTRSGNGMLYTHPNGQDSVRIMPPGMSGRYPYPEGRVIYTNPSGKNLAGPNTNQLGTPDGVGGPNFHVRPGKW